MEKQKRKLRGYKATDKDYNRALKRAIKEKNPLATQIEEWIIKYGKKGEPIESNPEIEKNKF